jgi:tetratricopeptide (TPR) repeat protein
VYFNTFYNAKKYYKEGSNSSPPNKELLKKAIEKCEKVVKYHPNSKYVPEALYIMGKCFLLREEYDFAVTKFKEIIKFYPNHKVAPLAQVELIKTYINNKKYIEAMNELEKMKIKSKREEFLMLELEIYLENKEYEKVIEIGENLLKQTEKNSVKGEILIKMGESYDSLTQYSNAIKYYEEALNYLEKKFILSFKIATLLIKLKQYKIAREKLISLRKICPKEKKNDLEMQIAKTYKGEEDYDMTIKILKNIVNSGISQYEMGIIYEKEFNNLEKALECYQNSLSYTIPHELREKLTKKVEQLKKMKEYKEKLKSDEKKEELPKYQFMLAELYWLEFGKIEESIKEYEKIVKNYPSSPYGIKALYAIGWLYENKINDTGKAVSIYKKIINSYPDTVEYVKKANKRIKKLENESKDKIQKKDKK